MSNIDRPLSPHLLIYKPQLTSILSITHRITGAGLVAGTLLVTVWLLAALSGEHAFLLVQQFRESFIGQIMLFCWLFAFVYHFLNGIRHLKWDAGFGLDLKSTYRSGYIVVIGAAALTLAIWTMTEAR
jgi:succinate dehydrogenase / fumarate reductase cytochrome b subunit